jgi:hypothetical protein
VSEILNKDEIESWLLHQAAINCDICDGVKGIVCGELVNVAYIARKSGARINVIYSPGDTCPVCGSSEVDEYSPRTLYACGSSDYDQRPGTFVRGDNCKQESAGKGAV